jgi:hypothetical protein
MPNEEMTIQSKDREGQEDGCFRSVEYIPEIRRPDESIDRGHFQPGKENAVHRIAV